MALFYFHLHECGTVTEDHDGLDTEVARVRTVALENARDIMSAEVKAGKLCMACFIVIEDERHSEIMRVPFREAIELSGL